MNTLEYLRGNQNVSIKDLANYTGQEYVIIAFLMHDLENKGIIKSEKVFNINKWTEFWQFKHITIGDVSYTYQVADENIISKKIFKENQRFNIHLPKFYTDYDFPGSVDKR